MIDVEAVADDVVEHLVPVRPQALQVLADDPLTLDGLAELL
jgi:hypothetical protein